MSLGGACSGIFVHFLFHEADIYYTFFYEDPGSPSPTGKAIQKHVSII